MTARPLNKPLNIAAFRLFIFDLDGTLYDQKKLRKTITLHLFIRFLTLRANLLDLKIIAAYRREREKRKSYASPTLDADQFDWCSSVLGIPALRARKTIEYWMYKFPLPYLLKAQFRGVAEFFKVLKEHGKTIVIYSDFPVEEKLKALGLTADKYFCATDREISQLKPSAKALEWICKTQDCIAEDAFYIGDRDDTDGESARQAGIPYLIIDPFLAGKGVYYPNLINQFQRNNDQR
jgi:FMN phosphatase YigB (HAD superfamily)